MATGLVAGGEGVALCDRAGVAGDAGSFAGEDVRGETDDLEAAYEGAATGGRALFFRCRPSLDLARGVSLSTPTARGADRSFGARHSSSGFRTSRKLGEGSAVIDASEKSWWPLLSRVMVF